MRLTRKIAQVLRWERVCRVATAERASRRPRATVVVDVYDEDWSRLRGVMVQGTAELISAGPRFRRLRALLYAKYARYPEEAALRARRRSEG